MTPIRVLITSNIPVVRAGLGALLADLLEIQVVGFAGGARETIAMIRARQPSVVISESFGEESGLHTIRRIISRCPDVRVILIALPAQNEEIAKLPMGVARVLPSSANASDLRNAIKHAAEGSTYVTRRSVAQHPIHARNHSDPSNSLTPRQRQILQLVVQGVPTK